MKLLRKLPGPGAVSSLLEMEENSAIEKYFQFLMMFELSDDGRKALSEVILDELEHEHFFAETKRRFHAENIRDLVLGMNDGLVELPGTVTGLSVAYVNSPRVVGISGLIVGVAGALSMAIGAFISVKFQRPVNESIRRGMEVLFTVSPVRAKVKLFEKLVESGMPGEIAEEIAEKLSSNHEALMKLLVGEGEAKNEVRSAVYTGLAYLLGVLFPVLPYFFAPLSLASPHFGGPCGNGPGGSCNVDISPLRDFDKNKGA